jgi:tryptophan synthase beta subunit
MIACSTWITIIARCLADDEIIIDAGAYIKCIASAIAICVLPGACTLTICLNDISRRALIVVIAGRTDIAAITDDDIIDIDLIIGCIG